MNYIKKKHLKQEVYLKTIIFKSIFFFILQIKSININLWSFLQKQLAIFNIKIITCSVSLLKKKGFSLSKKQNEYLKTIYNGNISIIYPTSNFFLLDQYVILQNITTFLKKVNYLILLYIFFLNRMLELDFLDKFSQITVQSIQAELICLLLRIQSPLNIIQSHSYFFLKKLSKKNIL
jgi:hypothetical protein